MNAVTQQEIQHIAYVEQFPEDKEPSKKDKQQTNQQKEDCACSKAC